MLVRGVRSGAAVDLRAKAADATASLLSQGQKLNPVGADGTVSITVDNDDLMGQAALRVVIYDGQVVAKQSVTIGEN